MTRTTPTFVDSNLAKKQQRPRWLKAAAVVSIVPVAWRLNAVARRISSLDPSGRSYNWDKSAHLSSAASTRARSVDTSTLPLWISLVEQQVDESCPLFTPQNPRPFPTDRKTSPNCHWMTVLSRPFEADRTPRGQTGRISQAANILGSHSGWHPTCPDDSPVMTTRRPETRDQ